MTNRTRSLPALLAIVLVGCLLAQPLLAAEHVVQIVGISFSPPALTVNVGDKVTWVNTTSLSHTSTSGVNCTSNGIWSSPLLGPNQMFSHTFDSEGDFPYFCIPHCSLGMTGQITVSGLVPTESATWGKIKELYRIGQ